MSKLALHYQRIPSWASRYPFPWAKVVNPPEVNPFPAGVKVVGRMYMPEGEEATYIMRGEAGGRDYFRRWQEAYSKRPWVHAWEGTNEFIPDTTDKCKLFDDFTCEWAAAMEWAGLLSVGLNLSVGWPQYEDMDLFRYSANFCDYVGLHEYAAPRMQDGGGHWTLRYRKFYEACSDARILITECGIDGGVCGKPQQGWRRFCSEADYLAQLQWYDSELAKDAYVKAAFVFTAGYEKPWDSFDVPESLAAKLYLGHAWEQRLSDAAQAHVIPQNAAAAFYRYGRARGWEPISREFGYEDRCCQVWYEPETQTQHILTAVPPRWDRIMVIDRAN